MHADFGFVEYLYKKYYYELIFIRKIQSERIIKSDFKPHFDDIEAELLYMMVREFNPSLSVEFSPYYGYSTSWFLSALNRNNHGILRSYDIVDYAYPKIKGCGLLDRWELMIGDVAANYPVMDYSKIDFLFIDSDHSRGFAQRYIREFLTPFHEHAKTNSRIIPVMIHDIYSWETEEKPTEEGEEVLNFLNDINVNYFTASCFYPDFKKVKLLRESLGIVDFVHNVEGNPSVLFFLGV